MVSQPVGQPMFTLYLIEENVGLWKEKKIFIFLFRKGSCSAIMPKYRLNIRYKNQ